MKIAIVGKNNKEIENFLKKKNIKIVKENPDFVISHGGDGTFLISEFMFPDVPKLILKDSRICKLCDSRSNQILLDKFIKKEFSVKENIKLEAIFKNKKIFATNDITVHNVDPRHGIRYSIKIDNEKIQNHEIIGDGIVVATPKIGASGYYRSITDSIFNVGIGLAFNNSTETFDHMVLEENSIIEIEITRGPANVYADNQENYFILKNGDKLIIRKSKEICKIVDIN